jgi:single-strand DNA-binding protein
MINQSILMGRLTRDVELRYSQGGDMAIARFTLAVERDYKAKDEEKPATDFIGCKAFGKTAEFISKYFRQGSMLAVVGSIQTGSYEDKDGKKVYTTDVIVNKASFTGEKADGQQAAPAAPAAQGDGFMTIPTGLEEELPFN